LFAEVRVSDRPPSLSRDESERIDRRRRARNWALLIALVALAALFYAISIVKMTKA
jgi:hypothetical protein